MLHCSLPTHFIAEDGGYSRTFEWLSTRRERGTERD